MVKDYSVSTLHPRNVRVTYTPPFRRIPKWERFSLITLVFFGSLAGPAWFIYHLPDYRGGLGLHKSYLKKQEREALEADKSS